MRGVGEEKLVAEEVTAAAEKDYTVLVIHVVDLYGSVLGHSMCQVLIHIEFWTYISSLYVRTL